MLHKLLLLSALCTLIFAEEEVFELPSFPSRSQQCQDDAGPRWEEDIQNFGRDKFYWSDSHAKAVLNQDGTCAGPVEQACTQRSNPLQAYIEGPISCPDAWFCRIFPDPNHGSGVDFLGDRNYGDCDKPSNLWEDTNTDQDGHCHGGLHPDSYYWWVRDHWNRPYSGRVKCCCVDSMEIPGTTSGARTMDLRGIVNRCDYRAQVTIDHHECRDANEDHNGGRMGSGFLYGFDGPCPLASDGRSVAYTREPADEMCWEILNFGIPDDGDNDDSISSTSTGPCTGAGRGTRGSCDGNAVLSGVNAGPYTRPDGSGPAPTFGPEVVFTYPPEPTQPANGNSGNGNNNGGSEDTEDEPEEETEGESESDSEDEDDDEDESEDEASQVVVSETSACASGRALADADACRMAAEKLDLRYKRSINRADRPSGCYKRRNSVWYNTNASGRASEDRLAICCSSDNCSIDEGDEDEDDEELACFQSSQACQTPITDEEICGLAAETLGMELTRVISNRRRVRGCYVHNNKVYFNENTSRSQPQGGRKVLCMGTQ